MENAMINELKNKVADFKEIIASFAELLQEENAALEKFDVETVSGLFDRKSKMVAAYRNMTAYLIKNHEALQELEEAERNSLKQTAGTLDTLLKRNDVLLKTRMETSQNVMNTIINIAKVTNNSNATSYGAQGRYTPLDSTKNALAVNRTL